MSISQVQEMTPKVNQSERTFQPNNWKSNHAILVYWHIDVPMSTNISLGHVSDARHCHFSHHLWSGSRVRGNAVTEDCG